MGQDERSANVCPLFRMDGNGRGIELAATKLRWTDFRKNGDESVLGEAPIRRNMPTEKSLIMQGERNFAAERQRLLDWVDRFSTGGPERCTTHPHCFFGSMSPNQWAILTYKHLDHHLKQFNA
jgi:hypothetical protein